MIITVFLIVLIFLILSHSSLSLHYAFHGLTLWYGKMVPTLLPMMILSGFIVKKNLASSVISMFHPIIHLFYHVKKEVSYAMVMGFLGGFPMGAKTAVELYNQGQITKKDAEYILAFCNNFGPIYLLGFALPILGLDNLTISILSGYYIIPALYGLFLRYSSYRESEDVSSADSFTYQEKTISIMQALYEAIKNALESIIILCGYMVIFNLLNLVVHICSVSYLPYFAPFIEITGGLGFLNSISPYYGLCMLSFGGICCYAQTYSILCETDLSFMRYCKHKVVQTILCAIYFFFFAFL